MRALRSLPQTEARQVAVLDRIEACACRQSVCQRSPGPRGRGFSPLALALGGRAPESAAVGRFGKQNLN